MADFDPDAYLAESSGGGGGNFDPDQYLKGTTSYGTAESAASGFAKGLTANWRDEIYGASRASGLPEIFGGLRAPVGAARLATEKNKGRIGFGGTLFGGHDREAPSDTPGPVQKEYEAGRDEMRAQEQEMQRQHPYAFGAGELGGAAADVLALPGAAPAASIAGRVGQSALAGAGYGAAAGAGEGEGAAGTGIGAVTGGLTGAALGTVGGGLAEALSPVATRVANAVRGFRDPDAEASRRIAQHITTDWQHGGPAFTPEEIAEMNAAGTPRALVNVAGERTRALARSAANTSPEARQALTEFTQEGFEQQSPRIAGYIRNMIGGGHSVDDLEAIQAQAARMNRPAYRAAYAAGENGIWTPELERLAGSPAVRRAMENAVERGRDRAVAEGFGAFNPGVTFENGVMQFGRGRGAPPYPNMQYWDYVQRELRDMGTAAARAGHNEQASAFRTLHRQLLGELDAANPAFQTARRGAAGFFDANDALEAGHNFATSAIASPADQLASRQAIARMSPADRALFARGYASRLADMVERSGDNRNVLNAAFLNNVPARQRTQLALGPQNATRLEALLRAERIVDRARTAIGGNSTTARQLVEMGLAGGAESLLEQDFNPSHILGTALLYGAARRGAQVIDQGVARRVGEMLASNDPAILARGLQVAARQPNILNALRRATGPIAGAGTEAVETSGQRPKQGFKHGGVPSGKEDGRQARASGGHATFDERFGFDDSAFQAAAERQKAGVKSYAKNGVRWQVDPRPHKDTDLLTPTPIAGFDEHMPEGGYDLQILRATGGRIIGAKTQSQVALSQNAPGTSFRCGTCEYFEKGRCHNPNPELKGRKVKPHWCCNLYDHPGMKVIETEAAKRAAGGRAEGGPPDDDLSDLDLSTLTPIGSDPASRRAAQIGQLRESATPEWSKPFAGMSPQQANEEARLLQGPQQPGKIGPGYLSDTDRTGMAAADAASWLAPELKGAAVAKPLLGIFAGPMAKTADKGALETAQKMATARQVLSRGRSGRPIASEPLPIGTEGQILDAGAKPNYPALLEGHGPEFANATIIDHEGNVVHNPLSRESVGGPMLRINQDGSVSRGLLAYHGSPHDFDRFDLSRIGTGEGAQAYGHGLYFAENEEVGKGYRDALAKEATYQGEHVSNLPMERRGIVSAVADRMMGGLEPKAAIANAAKDWREAAESARGWNKIDDAESFAKAADETERLDPADFKIDHGHLYQVAINADPSHFLDWDKPLSEQPEHIQKAIEPLRQQLWKEWQEVNPTLPEPTHIGQVLAAKGPESTEVLRSAGIPGVRYLDQGSRAGGDGTRNYVVFDDRLVDILKRYNQNPAMYNPPSREVRPFEADYPNGAQADDQGRLTSDAGGKPLNPDARFIAGRRVVGGVDQGIPSTPGEYDALAKAMLGRPAQMVEPSDLPQRSGKPVLGVATTPPGAIWPASIRLNKNLSAEGTPLVYGHELGHVIDEIAGQVPTKGLSGELKTVYNDLNNPDRKYGNRAEPANWGKPFKPETAGYPAHEVPREHIAEAIRAYMFDPNYLKSVAPKTAAAIRAFVNSNPKLRDIIQFNALPLAGVGLGAVGMGAGKAEQYSRGGRIPSKPAWWLKAKAKSASRKKELA